MNRLDLIKELAEWAAELRSIHGPSIFLPVEPGSWDRLVKLSGKIQETADNLLEEVNRKEH